MSKIYIICSLLMNISATVFAHPILIKNATIFDGRGNQFIKTDILLHNGLIKKIGTNIGPDTLPFTQIIDAEKKFVTPGLIDVHSHLGNYPAPAMNANADGNEMTDPVSAHVWTQHSIWPEDPGFEKALEGGVTTLQILPGSGNLIGGRGITIKNNQKKSYQAMRFPNAKQAVKIACGENPKRVYGSKGQFPSTSMGNMAGYRKAFIDAKEYQEKIHAYNDGKKGSPPKRDLKLETLAGILDGELLVHNHCYKSSEMINMLELADEFNFNISTFHHAIEFYKIAELLANKGVCGALWSDWWGFKLEAYDAIEENAALSDRFKNSCVIIHSDDPYGIQRLNQDAGNAMSKGNRINLNIKPEHAIKWITYNAAKSLGVEKVTGSIEESKMADIVIWNQSPLSVYAKAEYVIIDGYIRYNKLEKNTQPHSDFLVGNTLEK